MAGKKVVIQDTVFQNSGGLRIGPNAAIEIRDADSDVLVTLWEDREAASGESNPFSADANGQFTVYADPGRVKITVTISGDTRDWVDVWLLDIEADGTLNIDQIDEHTSGAGIQIDGVPEIGNAVRFDRDKNCLLHMPLKNSLSLPLGVGSATFTRSTIGTYIDRYGVVQTAAIDEPRFEKEGFLAEGEITNFAFRSDDFNDAYWTKTQSSITPNDETAPDGVAASADKLVDTAVDTEHSIVRAVVAATDSTVPNALSIFAKADEITQIGLIIADASIGNRIEAIFDLSGGIVLSATNVGTGSGAEGSIEALANGWFRCVLTGTPATSGTTVDVRVRLAKSGTTAYLGNGSDGAHIWGLDLEELPFASSYIATVAAAVTRTTDNLEVMIEGNIGLQADVGTWLHDVDVLGFITAASQMSLRAFGETQRILTVAIGGVNNEINFHWGIAATSSTIVLSPNTTNRLGMKHTGGGALTGWLNGVKIATRASTDVSDALGSTFTIGASAGASPLYGHVSNLRIYDRALNDGEMGIA